MYATFEKQICICKPREETKGSKLLNHVCIKDQWEKQHGCVIIISFRMIATDNVSINYARNNGFISSFVCLFNTLTSLFGQVRLL